MKEKERKRYYKMKRVKREEKKNSMLNNSIPSHVSRGNPTFSCVPGLPVLYIVYYQLQYPDLPSSHECKKLEMLNVYNIITK